VAEYNALQNLDLTLHPTVEAQVAAMADDIAYHSHDLDDGMRAKFFAPDDLAHLPVVGAALVEARRASLDVPPARLRNETIRRVINALVTDLMAETSRRIAALDPADVDAIRRARYPVVGFSPAMAEANRVIKEFLFARMYRHWRVNRMTAKARGVVGRLFALLHADPSLLPGEWRVRAGDVGGSERAATIVTDYISGMTDRFAFEEFRRLTDLSIPG
jgi:dGTPase